MQKVNGFILPLFIHTAAMPLLSNDMFLAALRSMFEAQHGKESGKGSIYVTQKHGPRRRAEDQPSCLYRASDGQQQKCSTLVTHGNAAKFHPLLMSLLKVRGAGHGAASPASPSLSHPLSRTLLPACCLHAQTSMTALKKVDKKKDKGPGDKAGGGSS
jgi:hypothetical protein